MLHDTQLRYALARYLGRELTAEAAAHIYTMATTNAALAPLVAPLEPRRSGEFTVQVERVGDVLADLERLWREQWHTTEGFRSELGFDPDYDGFVEANDRGQLILFTLRDAARQMVGDMGFYFYKSRHTSKLTAAEDFYYVTPAARQGLASLALLRYGVDSMRALGATHVGFSTKDAVPIDPLMRRIGFEPYGRMWCCNFPANVTHPAGLSPVPTALENTP